jgi:hypothetical protein
VIFEWDEQKRLENLEKHGLDFADAYELFCMPLLTALDLRQSYGEDRIVGIGFLGGQIAVIVFVERKPQVIRVISLRKAKQNERQRLESYLSNQLGSSRSTF